MPIFHAEAIFSVLVEVSSLGVVVLATRIYNL